MCVYFFISSSFFSNTSKLIVITGLQHFTPVATLSSLTRGFVHFFHNLCEVLTIVLNKSRIDMHHFMHVSVSSTNLDDNQATCYDRLRQNSMITQRLQHFFPSTVFSLSLSSLTIKQMLLWTSFARLTPARNHIAVNALT